MTEQQQRDARERLDKRQQQYDDGQPIEGILERQGFFGWLKVRYPEAQRDLRLALDALDRVRALIPNAFEGENIRAALDGDAK